MRRAKVLASLAIAALPAACAPNPIVARDPVSAPTAADAYTCDSRPTLLNAFHTNCDPKLRERPVVLRSKG